MTRRTPLPFLTVALLTVAVLAGAAGCATMRQIVALRQVNFTIDGVANVRLAGIDVSAKRSYRDFAAAEATRLAAALARRDLPLAFDLHLLAENPAENRVTARLIRMEWTLLLEDQETISGAIEREITFPPGEPRDLPIAIQLNLVDFFQQNAEHLVDLALNLAGQGGETKRIKLQALPTIETALGPITYPGRITIVSREVGRTGEPAPLHTDTAPEGR
jgi:hypothetical protein